MLVAATLNTAGAMHLIGTIVAVLVGVVGLTIVASSAGRPQPRKIAEKVVAVVIGASMVAGAAIWATVNITGNLIK
jgi:hypothetical protein